MVSVIKLESWKELDMIFPMLMDFHSKSTVYKIYPVSGFLSWLTLNYLNPNLAVFGIFRDGAIVGYSICEVGWKWMEKECTIVDAVFSENREDLAPALEKEIEAWAALKACVWLTAITTRPEVMERKYHAGYSASIVTRSFK